MSKKVQVLLSVLCLAALALSIGAFALVWKQERQPEDAADIQYVLYLGTNDKDSNEPVFPPEEAKQLLDDLMACEDPWHCPHGRPTVLTFSREDLEKRFKRIV